MFTVTKLQTMTTEAPKRKKNASRKNKKSWRKNVDIEDVEEFLEEERLEERLGGKFADRKDEQGWVQQSRLSDLISDLWWGYHQI